MEDLHQCSQHGEAETFKYCGNAGSGSNTELCNTTIRRLLNIVLSHYYWLIIAATIASAHLTKRTALYRQHKTARLARATGHFCAMVGNVVMMTIDRLPLTLPILLLHLATCLLYKVSFRVCAPLKFACMQSIWHIAYRGVGAKEMCFGKPAL